jgi:YVTN family beta-propeller protein
MGADGNPLVADDTTDRLHKAGPDGRPSTYYEVGKTPFAVVTDPVGNAYVACWGSKELTIVSKGGEVAHVKVGSHPTGLAVRPDPAEVWVANTNDDTLSVVDVGTRKVTRTVPVPAYDGAPYGAAPVALAFAPDGKRLYVALAGANVLAVVDPAAGKVVGRIPTAWYPSGLAVAPDGKHVYVSCAKGFGQGPRRSSPVWKMKGSVHLIDTPDDTELAALTTRADQANHFDQPVAEPAWLPPIKHVVYVLRENRTYDQVLGDLARGDGDPSLTIYGREVTPNIHALAERFAFGDHFLCDGEVSAQGHEWAQGAIATDATERLYPAEYAKSGRWADASQHTLIYTDSDYLVERCVRKRVSVRVYGEALRRGRDVDLKGVRSCTFKGWDLRYPDMDRVAAWEAEFKAGTFPAFEHVWLPRDHTMATIPFVQTPRSMVADNDAATGRLVDVLSHDPRWKDTLVIIQEDDAQGGYDHVDGHRSIMVLASPWIKGGTVTSKHYSQVALVATVERLLGLGTLTQFDAKAPIIDDVWSKTPDLRPYTAIAAKVSTTDLNAPDAPLAEAFDEDDFGREDDGDQALLARALWLEAHTR